ncbi:hypothetical protein IQ260_01010 [Leptolyngbya cf. ectocarpi LEGE 11479]|uniref:Uncharacterized protein n=1 Tax=Leptolyngbya cf. ectocarpi LEGE 11479 TaxID=1828722 RepID=A0A928ZSI3_LEPEC|nr:hypothetical protein [Leptolyngbya ectocarpi]MBE9065231.1 hypothetical protein [Leptolyngbya cf. ectocarpi LEGE 11479]
MVAVRKPEISPEVILQQVWNTHKLTRKDYVRLSSFLLSIVELTPHQREQVHHIFDELSMGKIQLIDQ